MNFSSRYVVAIHILTALAVRKRLMNTDVSMKSEMLSWSVNTNPVVVRRIISKLREAGIVTASRGPEGGTRLSSDPKKLTLLDIYNAVDDGVLFHLHYSIPNQECPVGKNIQAGLKEALSGADKAMRNYLAKYSLSDISSDIIERSKIKKLIENGADPKKLDEQFRKAAFEYYENYRSK